jgi:RNA polymerase sigma-70 factor (ECF subfamily)
VTFGGDAQRSRIFLASLAADVRAGFAQRAELESVLGEVVDRARAAWPDFDVPDATYLRFLAARVRASNALETLRVTDLFAACACAARDTRAIMAVESRYFPQVTLALARMRLRGRDEEDVLQALRRQLFVADDGNAGRIGQYTGQGDLRAWMQVIATRAALKLIRRDRREVSLSDAALLEAGTTNDDIELSYVKRLYREEFKAAFDEALHALSARDKTLLRLQLVDDLSIDQIGALHQVHRATAARWLARARETLLDKTRELFMLRARVSKTDCDSIMRALHSQLDLTIRRRLTATE